MLAMKDSMMNKARGMHPSLAFMLGSGIPDASTTGVDPRQLPFADISPQLRDQRQQLASQVPSGNNPFSLATAINSLQRQANTPR
jgi:hypothetical protein